MRHASAALLLCLAAATSASAGAFADGQAAWRQNRIAEARRDYAAAAADAAAPPAERAGALRELGRLDWLVDADAPAATGRLRAAIQVGADTCASAILLARVLRESGQPAAAAAEAARRLPGCETAAERTDLARQGLAADLDLAAASPQGRARALAAAEAAWAAMRAEAAGDLDAERSALELAVMRRDPAAALQAWKGYFWLTGADASQGLPAYAGRVGGLFVAGLGAEADAAAQLALLELLIRAGFDQAAGRFAEDAHLPARAASDPAWLKAERYLRVTAAVRADLLAMNRTLARSGSTGDFEAFKALMIRRGRELTGLDDPKAARAAMQRDYGLNGVAQQTGRYPSLHMGHIVQDDRHPVEQFGRTAGVHFLAIDNMLSNGFESWLWDGTAEAGGWSEDGGSITQVRSAYTGGPVLAWSLVGDSPLRRKVEGLIAAGAAADAAAAHGGAIVPQPSVGRRLRLQAVDAIAARARVGLKPGQDLRTAFLGAYWTISLDQSIFLHEGRHALDQAAKPEIGELPDAELEFRAKLSELELGAEPKLSLYQIDGDLLGGDTPHGKANARIVAALRDWAAAHSGEVAGYDPAVPALSQLDKLSDAQIRKVAASLDPWAHAAAGPPAF